MTSPSRPQRQQRVPTKQWILGCLMLGVICYVGNYSIEDLSHPRSLEGSLLSVPAQTPTDTNSLRTGMSNDDSLTKLTPTRDDNEVLGSSPFHATPPPLLNKYAPQSLPPLHTLVSRTSSEIKHVVANVQFLLDFAIVGFEKAGTTTLRNWLMAPPSNHPNDDGKTANSKTATKLIQAPPHEPLWLREQNPAKAVGFLYKYAQQEETLRLGAQLLPHQKLLKGYKNPSDVRRPAVRDLLASYWPQTKLIVTVRHPVKWLESLYNYNMIEKFGYSRSEDVNMTANDLLTGRDVEGVTPHFVSTGKGEFHAILAELGKTPLVQDSPEWKLLQPWIMKPYSSSLLKEEDKKNPSQVITEIQQHRMPNKIFFMETRQLADENQTRSQQFAHDLEQYLGLPRNYLSPTPLHVRPDVQFIKLNKTATDQYRMDICAPQWAPVLEEMMAISRAASPWLRQYFMRSPDVFVSSPEYLKALLEEWMINPCTKG